MEGYSASRTKNTKRNIVSGLIKQVTVIVFPFLIRTIILYVLGAQYQGLNGLFTSIIQVLNLSDLGFTTAVTFILYKPIAENDHEALCAITAFFRNVYRIIGLVILTAGLAITPFLKFLISGDVPADINVYVLFLIYLFNTVISYWLFAYKGALFNAMQRSDVVSNVYTITNLFIKIIQVVLLLVVKNYYVYIVLLPLGTLANNLLLHFFSKTYFPEIVPKGKIDKETKRNVIKQVKALFIGKFGSVARNSFDNIVISSMIGLVTVAIYDNYYSIFTALYGLLLVVTQAMQASVGNSLVKESVEKNYKDFNLFTFIFMWIIGWCTVCLFNLYQPFMLIWMRNDHDMLLSFSDMGLLTLYFYILNMNNTRNLYLEGNGLYHECRWWFLIEALGNLTLNFVLGYYLGVTGVILATIITIFSFNFVARTNVVFKHYFKFLPIRFYLSHSFYFVITAAACAATFALCRLIPLEGLLGFIAKAGVCLVVPNVVFLSCYFKLPYFKESLSFGKRLLTKNHKKEI